MEVIEAVRVAPMSADPLSYACIIKHYELEAAIPNDSLFENLSETLKEQLKLTMEKINLFTREKFNIVDSVESLVAWTTHLPERVDLEHELMSLLQRVPKERGWLRRKEARRVRDFVKLRTRELNELLAIHATITTPHYALARHSATITQLFGYSENELLARKIEVLQKLRSEYFLVPSPETSSSITKQRNRSRSSFLATKPMSVSVTRLRMRPMSLKLRCSWTSSCKALHRG